MTHIFPEDGTLEEYLDRFKDDVSDRWGMTDQQYREMREYQYHQRKRTFEGMLIEARNSGLHTIMDPIVKAQARTAIDIAMSIVVCELKSSIPTARWVLHDYVGEYDSKTSTVIEHTRPTVMSPVDYWDLVNN